MLKLLDKRILTALLGLILAIGAVFNIDFVAKYGCMAADALGVQSESCNAVEAIVPAPVAPVALPVE